MQFRSLPVTLLAALLLVQQEMPNHAHILLTYPPARHPHYDYLDNYRTGGPCGVEADPNGDVTTLQAGSTFNVTYYLSYPHRGGIRVNILNATGHVIYALLGLQETFVNSEDITRQHHEVTLPPGFECERCILQIQRQAKEFIWINSTFWSCADIAIIDSPDAVCDAMTCSGHGTCVNGECVCDRLYSGEICQNKDECEDAGDCSGHGFCIDIQSTTHPTKQCYCSPGWFGQYCSKPSSLTSAIIDPNDYTISKQLHPKLTLYAKVDGAELEVALKLNGTSYVGLGWKPMEGIVRSCNNLIPPRMPVGSNPLWQHALSFPVVKGADSFYNQLAEINSTYTPEDKLGTDIGTLGLHPMDCTDIVIGTARGEQSRVFDYFTRDRGEPYRDDFYNGVDSLTAAVGREEDGFTYIKWRRPLVTGDSAADHNIENKNMTLIWAFGQVSPEYHHRFLSNQEFNITQNQRFFPVDQLKYHGGKNRGATAINFFQGDTAGSATVVVSSVTLLLGALVMVQLMFY